MYWNKDGIGGSDCRELLGGILSWRVIRKYLFVGGRDVGIIVKYGLFIKEGEVNDVGGKSCRRGNCWSEVFF